MGMALLLRRAPWCTAFAMRRALLLYHDLCGRTLRLEGEGLRTWARFGEAPRPAEGPDVDAGAVRALVEAGFLVPPDFEPGPWVAGMYPVRGRWAVFHDPPGGPLRLAERVAGADAGWRVRALSPVEAFVWRRLDGRRTAAELLDEVEARGGAEGRDEAAEALAYWTHGRVQLVKLLERPLAGDAPPPPRFYTMVHHLPLAGAPAPDVDLDAYHREVIADATEQFEARETTLSHLLRHPTPVLGGRAYGAALGDALADWGAPLEAGARVLEVGGGTGWLARRLLDARPGLRYHVLDLSPALQRGQRARLGDHARLVRGDARALPFAAGSFDVLISNEVIADLPAARVDPAAPPPVVARLGVVPPAPRVTNVGALRFLEEVHRVLRPGGVAFLSEYGEVEGEPEEARHLDHPEVGIEFGVLARAARHLGFADVHLTDVVDLLGFAAVPVLSVPPAQHEALAALLAALGAGRLEKRAYTPDAFAALCGDAVDPATLHHLSFTPATERLMSFPPRRVRALLLRR